MKTLLLIIFVTFAGKAQEKDALPDLINKLCEVKSLGFSLDFIGDEVPPEFSGGGSKPPSPNQTMKKIVQIGPDAIPELIKHLDDKRPTKLKVGKHPMMSRWFDAEYDPKNKFSKDVKPQETNIKNTFERSFKEEYTVKVGDVCFVLIGQIVNRELLSVRYQPSFNMVINSPIESPELIERIKEDWGNIDKKGHLKSLVDDLYKAPVTEVRDAAIRIRFYYPSKFEKICDDYVKHQSKMRREEKGK